MPWKICCVSQDRRHRDFPHAAALPANLWAGVKIAQVLGQTNPHLLQDAVCASHTQHDRPQPGVGSDERAYNIDWRPGLLFLGGDKWGGNNDGIACAPHIGKIVGRTFPGAGAVLLPFVPGKSFIGIKSLRRLQRRARRKPCGGTAIRGVAPLILRPQPMHDETEIGARVALAACPCARERFAEARRPGERKNVKIEIAGRARAVWGLTLSGSKGAGLAQRSGAQKAASGAAGNGQTQASEAKAISAAKKLRRIA